MISTGGSSWGRLLWGGDQTGVWNSVIPVPCSSDASLQCLLHHTPAHSTGGGGDLPCLLPRSRRDCVLSETVSPPLPCGGGTGRARSSDPGGTVYHLRLYPRPSPAAEVQAGRDPQ